VAAQEAQEGWTPYFVNVYRSKLFIYGRRKVIGANKEKDKTEVNIESKKHKHEKGAVHNVTREPTPKCVVCHGPHQVTSCKNWGETSIAKRCMGNRKKRMNFVIVV